MRYKLSTPAEPAARPARHAEDGFTLVEVLVAIVVLSFGLLGMVGLQAAALKYNRDARNQSVAVSLARELAEMMRSNAQVAGLTTGNPYYGSFSGTALAPSTTSACLSIGNTCASTTDLANAQMTDWLTRVEDALPGARVEVCDDSAPYDTNGLPVWTCTPATATAPISVIKLGWTREDTQNKVEFANATKPYVVFPVTPGGQS